MLVLALQVSLAAAPLESRLDVQFTQPGSTCQVIRHQAADASTPTDFSFEVLKTPGEASTESCRPIAELYVTVARATCGSTPKPDVALLLKNPLTFELPTSSTGTFEGSAQSIGCALVTTSGDGLVRVWTLVRGFRDDEGRLTRGAALLQWRDHQGRLRVADARAPDLGLDARVESIEALPGVADLYLVTGISSTGDFVRFARVLRLSPDGRPSLAQVVQRGPGWRGELLLRAPAPETGKLRHSLLLPRWLRFDAALSQLLLEPVPDERRAVFLQPATEPTEVVAEWVKGKLVVKGAQWGAVSLVR